MSLLIVGVLVSAFLLGFLVGGFTVMYSTKKKAASTVREPPRGWEVINLPVPSTMIQLLDQLALENKMDRQGATRVVMMMGAMALIESSEMKKPTIMQ